MSSETTARKTVFFNRDGSFDRTKEAEGPRINVKVVQDGEFGGKAVKKGQTLAICERDAIREMFLFYPPVVEIDASKLTRMGSIFLHGRGHGYYEEPVGTKGHIPKIKIVGRVDNALVGNRVLMKGEVGDLPEDVVWALLGRKRSVHHEPAATKNVFLNIKVSGKDGANLTGRRVSIEGDVVGVLPDREGDDDGQEFALAPGAQFTLSPEVLNAMIASADFNVYAFA